MNRVLPFICLLCLGLGARAQKNYFIYLQADGGQTFYIKPGNEIISSSSAGHLILAGLPDSSIRFTLGFPGKTDPALVFTIQQNGTDCGFEIKKLNEEWVLFNIKTLQLIRPGPTGLGAAEADLFIPDTFADMLANAVDDPSVRLTQKPNSGKTSLQTPPPGNPDTLKAIAPKPPDPPRRPNRGFVMKTSETMKQEGLELVYVDNWANGKFDTISLVIPNMEIPGPAAAAIEPAAPDTLAGAAPASDTRFLNFEVDNPNKQKDSLNAAMLNNPEADPVSADSSKTGAAVIINKQCKTEATVYELARLRRQLVNAKTENQRISAIAQAAKTTCFSTAQLRNLTDFFPTDEGKYKLYDTVYPTVYDPSEFIRLETTITDEYYKGRFLAMIRK